MRVFITAATIDEWMPSFLAMDTLYTSDSNRMKIMFHQGGVGMLATAVALTKLVFEEKPDLIIQAGIAGCFDANIPLGTVLIIKEEMLGDTGVDEDGKWKDIFDMKLEKPGYPPFEKKRLPNQHLAKYNLLQLPEIAAVTVNEITTKENRIQQLVKKYNPVLESMEGAALHYVCRQMNIPFVQMRAVSNYIGERDKSKWQIKLALDNLNKNILVYVHALYKMV